MTEYVNTYDIEQPTRLVPMKREQFYDEQIKIFKETGEITKIVDIIQVILFNEYGEILLQKRSRTKKHNANMIDKSIGGHINTGDLPNHTVMLETVQELQIPSIVLQTQHEFLKTHKLLKEYGESLAIIEYIDTRILNMKRKFKDCIIPIVSNTHFYLGLYNGKVKNLDREAKGILYYTIEEL